MRFRGPVLVTLTSLLLLGATATADAKPRLSIGDAETTEAGKLKFEVALRPRSDKAVTADYRTKPGTASQGDFQKAKGSLKVRPGKSSATITVATIDDSIDEQDETFTVSLSNPHGAKLADSSAKGTILDDDTVEPPTPDLVITEFLANPGSVADADGEWIELYNAGTSTADMSGVELLTGGTVRCTLSGSLAAGAYYVVAGNASAASNGGINGVGAACPLALLNTSGTIAVREAPGGSTIDSISYPSNTAGKSRSLDPDFLTAVGNDSSANFCDGTGAYGTGGDLGTPGAANPQCP